MSSQSLKNSSASQYPFESFVKSGTGYWRVNRGYPYGGDFCRTEQDTRVIILSEYTHNEHKVQFPNGDIGIVQNRYFVAIGNSLGQSDKPAHFALVLL